MESDPPDESEGPQALLQRAKAAMRGSPIKLADLALPSLGALGSVAISNEHDWPGETTARLQPTLVVAGPTRCLCTASAGEICRPSDLSMHCIPISCPIPQVQFVSV
jgi:hypothetical protein